MREDAAMRSKTWLVAVLGIAILALAAVGCGDSDSEDGGGSDTFRVGLEAPLSGELSVLGEGMLNGAELAATQLNARGGILGKQVEVVAIDDGGDPATG